MKFNGTKNKTTKINEQITIKNSNLIHKPISFYRDELGNLIHIKRRETAKMLCKKYPYIEVILEPNESIQDVRIHLESLLDDNLYIIKEPKKMRVVEFAFMDNQDKFNRNKQQKDLKGIKAGHQRHNASKGFKLRQAIGRDRVERFKLASMGIKIKKDNWNLHIKKEIKK